MKRLILPIIVCLLLCSCAAAHSDHIPGNTGNSMIMPPIMPSGSGYYYEDYSGMGMRLKYYDSATGQSIYLCARPECLHDGNEFCNATSSKYWLTGMTMYEGELYLNAVEWNREAGHREYKLLRAAKDGTELSEVGTYAKQDVDENSSLVFVGGFHPLIHRGKAYLCYRLDGGEDMSSSGVAEVDITTGASRIITEVSTNGKIDAGDVSGDRLFFVITVPESEDSYKYVQKLFCYNIATGELHSEKLPMQYFQDARAADGKYIIVGSDGYDARLISYDPESHEFANLDNDMSEFLKTDKGGGRMLEYDGTYFYAVKEILDKAGAYPAAVFSSDFRKLAEFTIPSEHGQPQFSLDILDGTVYLQYYYEVVSCPVGDIVAGNTHWDKAFEFDRIVDKEDAGNADS